MTARAEPAILLVEDNPDDAFLIESALARSGVAGTLVVAGDGASAVDLLHGADPIEPRVVLLDLHLPDMHGLDVLRRLRADPRTRRLPMVILSSAQLERDVALSYDAGANGYVAKPVDFNELTQAARQLAEFWVVLNVPPPDHCAHRGAGAASADGQAH